MERSLTNLIRISAIQNRILLRTCASVTSCTQKVYHNYSSSKKGLKPTEGHKLHSNDPFLSIIKSHKDSISILDYLRDKNIEINRKECLDVLNVIFSLSKLEKNVSNITNHKTFLRLCEKTQYELKFLSKNDLLTLLKIFKYFEIPSNSVIMQSILQYMKLIINDLSIEQLIFLSFLSEKMEKVPLAEAIHIAIPIILESRMTNNMYKESFKGLAEAFVFFSHLNNNNMVQLICTTLLKNPEHMDVICAKTIFKSFFALNCQSPDISQLFTLIQEALVGNVDKLQYTDIYNILKTISFTIASRKMEFYNTYLVDEIIDSLISQNVDMVKNCALMAFINNISYVRTDLLEHLTSQYLKDTSIWTLNKMKIYLQALFIADYKPQLWSTVYDCISKNNLEMFSNPISRKIALYLIALDYYSPHLLQKVFELDYSMVVLWNNNENINEYLYLYQSVKSLYPEFTGPWPSDDIISYLYKKENMKDAECINDLLLKSLEIALGGAQYVQRNLRTKLNHFIDGAIVMRKGGYPVAINKDIIEMNSNNSMYVEELACPPGSYILLILVLPETAFSLNNQRLNGFWSLKIKSIEALTGNSTVAINHKLWSNFPDFEKIPYVMQQIKEKLDRIMVD